MPAFLPRVGDRPGSRRCPGPHAGGLESVDVDGRVAPYLSRQCEGVLVGTWARAGSNNLNKRAVPPRKQLTNVGYIEQPLGPDQYPVADLEHPGSVDSAGHVNSVYQVGDRVLIQLLTWAVPRRSWMLAAAQAERKAKLDAAAAAASSPSTVDSIARIRCSATRL